VNHCHQDEVGYKKVTQKCQWRQVGRYGISEPRKSLDEKKKITFDNGHFKENALEREIGENLSTEGKRELNCRGEIIG